jgi:hypothetical protein
MPALARSLNRLLLATLSLAACACQEPQNTVLLIVDQNAGPDGRGAVFRKNAGADGVQLFATSNLLQQPQDILQQPDGSFLVLDYYKEGGVGKVFQFSKDGKKCEELKLPKGLVDPYQFEYAPDGSIWIVDKNADPFGLGKKAKRKTGTLWRLSKDRLTLEVIATGPPLIAPSAILFVGDDAFLMDADVFQKNGMFDPKVGEGAIFKVHKHPKKLEIVARFERLMSPLGMCREASGTYLVVDVNADPVKPDRHHGAVYRVDPKAKTTKLFANHDDFRDPVNCIMWQGRFLVVDANSDPLKLGEDGSGFGFTGGRGGIYEVDLKTGAVKLFLASPQFVNPIRLRKATL